MEEELETNLMSVRRSVKKHLNLNSFLIVGIGALLKFGLVKLDELNTQSITLTSAQSAMLGRLDRIEKDMVMRAEFRSEIERLEARIGNVEAGKR